MEPTRSHTGITPAAAPSIDPSLERKLRRATAEFEAIFLETLVKECDTTGIGGGATGESLVGTDIYRSMTEEAFSRKLAEQRSLGIADLLYRQILPVVAAGGSATHDAGPGRGDAKAPGPVVGPSRLRSAMPAGTWEESG